MRRAYRVHRYTMSEPSRNTWPEDAASVLRVYRYTMSKPSERERGVSACMRRNQGSALVPV